ncbi:hypothetical protein B566_EDAN007545 [Ephemera danica]|nr:hypothetical protein B566_EDAN007545 [Ephemera danica]
MARSIILLLLGIATLSVAQDCTWKINGDLPEFQPLYIKPGGSMDIEGFWLPQSGDVVTVPNGNQVLFACNGNTIVPIGDEEATLTCAGGSNWQDTNGNTYTFSSLACTTNPTHVARYTGDLCPISGGYRIIEVGFLMSNNDFYKIMELCFDSVYSDSIYSYFLQTPAIKGVQVGFPRPNFIQGSGFYPSGMGVDTLYTQNSQRDAVAYSVGSDTLAAQYIQDGTEFYLSRGHETAKADFVYGSHQRATFWFMNVAPQWQTFNGGNWQTMEANVQVYAGNYGDNLEIYTGIHGDLLLDDINGNPVPISLAFDTNDDGVIRAPFLIWKVLYDPVTRLGVAFVGLNNPYYDNPGSDFYLCPNVCDQITWLTWSPNDQIKGYTYCCEVPALAAQVPEIPPLSVSGLLT